MNHRGSLTKLVTLRPFPNIPSDVHEADADHIGDNETVLKMLNDAMATGLLGVVLYRRHHFMARSLHSRSIEQVFLAHSNAALGHADRLAARIVQLGGTPDFVPDDLTIHSDTTYGDGHNLSSMLRKSMLARSLAIDLYGNLIRYLGNSDATTRSVLEEILAAELRHNDELAEQLVSMHIRRHVAWPQFSVVAGQSCSATA
jgi:bacterioferritin